MNAIANPRSYAIDLVEEGFLTADDLLIACLEYMNPDAILNMLKHNDFIFDPVTSA